MSTELVFQYNSLGGNSHEHGSQKRFFGLPSHQGRSVAFSDLETKKTSIFVGKAGASSRSSTTQENLGLREPVEHKQYDD